MALAAPAPTTTTVVIQKEDKALTEGTATILTRQKALFLMATIDFNNCMFKDVAPPVFIPAFVSALKKKSTETKARAVVGLWNNFVEPKNLEINDTNYKGGTHDAYTSMTTLSLPLAKMIAQALWQPDLCTSPFGKAGKLDLNHFCPQNSSSAKVNEAIKWEKDDENEITFYQHDLHLGMKRTQAEKLGYIKDFLDGLHTIVNISILSLIIEIMKSKESIFFQLMSRFGRSFSSHLLTTWATKHALNSLTGNGSYTSHFFDEPH